MKPSQYLSVTLLLFATLNVLLGNLPNANDSCTYSAITQLEGMPITASTGEKPQSKLWLYDGYWWAVLPNESGTKLWKLNDARWEEVLHLSDSTNIMADTKVVGNVTHILFFQGWNSQLLSVEYDAKKKRYQLWSERAHPVKIHLEQVSETATIDVDLVGRMWLASDDKTEIHIRWSDLPYEKWSEPQSLATGIAKDDICAVTTFTNGSTGVMWSN